MGVRFDIHCNRRASTYNYLSAPFHHEPISGCLTGVIGQQSDSVALTHLGFTDNILNRWRTLLSCLSSLSGSLIADKIHALGSNFNRYLALHSLSSCPSQIGRCFDCVVDFGDVEHLA